MSKALKFGIILLILLSLVLFAITIFDLPVGQAAAGIYVTTDEEAPAVTVADPDLITAVEKTLASASDIWQVFDYQIDHIQVQDDGQMAIVWLAAIDPETGQILAREPELALAELGEDGNWVVLLGDEDQFGEAFKAFQYTEKSIQGDFVTEDQVVTKSTRIFGGYYLPWAKDLEKRLTWSMAHSSCQPGYCTYAFDFADGTMFPLVAAKGGTVFHWRDSCANNNSYCTNSITLQDRSTTPWTYQIYLHIANNSIPSHLKQVGTPVMQGQYIADVDNTGYSTGHHVHFMVVAENTRYLSGQGYIWGVAEDITYRDVDINWDSATQGGRPRLAYEADIYGGTGRTYYISGNTPAFPPTGGLTAPATKTHVTNPLLTVSGWGEDDIAVVKMEILANFGTNWVQIGSEQTVNPFTTTVDLCNTTIPNGPFRLGLRVWDYEGNPSQISTIRKLIKDVECGPSGTNPSVSLTKTGDTVILPENGLVSAEVTKGSTGNEIVSVEFWFHGRNWSTDNWVYLGKDVNGTNGWQAPISTTGMQEAGDYTLVAVATDSGGKTGVDVSFAAMVDRTPPWVTMDSVRSPVLDDSVTITWTGGDTLSGLNYYTLAVNVNNSGYQTLATSLPRTSNTFTFAVSDAQMVVFNLIGYDLAGNATSRKIAMYTDGYEFANGYILPSFFFDQ